MNEKARLLIIDDDPANRLLLGDLLAAKGYRVESVASGLEGLERLQAEGLPDLVLLDVVLPDIDGYRVCERIRALPSGSALPVVMMSGMDPGEGARLGKQAGASAVFAKPLDLMGLLELLERLTAGGALQ